MANVLLAEMENNITEITRSTTTTGVREVFVSPLKFKQLKVYTSHIRLIEE